jgi:predicted patatin/cPLA2 family phospholipase
MSKKFLFKNILLIKVRNMIYIILFLNMLAQIFASCNILALSGGGSFGAVEIGILDSLTSTKKIPNKYDIITGISVGGINTGFLSYFDDISTALPQMINTFTSLTNDDVYKSDILGILTHWSIYDNTPLENTLTNILKELNPSSNPPLSLIGMSNIYTNNLDIVNFNSLSFEDKITVLMSTSAIPIVFPPRKFNNSLYVDGGVISNEIINQVIGYVQCNYYNITLISAHLEHKKNKDITGLISYIEALVKMITNTFDSQLSQTTHCPYPKGQLNACFPTSPLLNNYSLLDFNNGLALYNLGKNNNTCIKYDLC